MPKEATRYNCPGLRWSVLAGIYLYICCHWNCKYEWTKRVQSEKQRGQENKPSRILPLNYQHGDKEGGQERLDNGATRNAEGGKSSQKEDWSILRTSVSYSSWNYLHSAVSWHTVNQILKILNNSLALSGINEFWLQDSGGIWTQRITILIFLNYYF